MKIYVDKLPKSCWECPCLKSDIEQGCGLDDEYKDYFLDEIDGGECPLHTVEEVQNEKAIRCLKKLKIFCQSNFNSWEFSEYEGNIYDKHDISNAYLNVEIKIDQLILELKEKRL